MQVNKTILSSSTLVTSGIALCIALLATGLPSSSLAACAHYQTQVLKAVQAKDLDRLEALLPTLEAQPDCPSNYLEWLKRSMAQIVARQADNLTPQGGLGEAKALLKRAPTIVWSTQVVRGDIAARQKQWQDASQFYNQALDLIADPQSTPNPPPQAVIQKIYNLASQAQILAGNLDATVSRSGQASGVMRSSVRGFKPRKRLIPVLFGFGRYRLSEKGEYAAQQLAAYIKQHRFRRVTLVGHTDSKGSHRVNNRISKRRANFLRRYLRRAGVKARIYTVGKGKRDPLQLDNPDSYTQTEIDMLNRRVEFVAK